MPVMDNAHALVVGISKYQRMSPLPDVVLHDAEDIAGLLGDPARGAYANVRLLPEQQATRQGLLDELAELRRKMNEDSVLFVYVSSHGGRLELPPHAGEYLLPIDADDSSAELLARTGISGQELGDAIRAIPARRKLIVFDCCHSAGVMKSGGGGRPAAGLERGLSDRYLEALSQGEGTVVLASSRSNEISWALQGARNSLFTTYLLKGMEGDVRPSESGHIRIFDLFEYVQRHVTDASAFSSGVPSQHPIFHAQNLGENFAVALHPRGAAASGAADVPYDTFVSFVDQEPDAAWVYEVLLPRLHTEGFKVATAHDTGRDIYRVVNIERGIQQSRRTLVALSQNYLADGGALFENVLSLEESFRRPGHRLLPIKISPIPEQKLPLRFRAVVMLDVTHKYRGAEALNRLVEDLKQRP